MPRMVRGLVGARRGPHCRATAFRWYYGYDDANPTPAL